MKNLQRKLAPLRWMLAGALAMVLAACAAESGDTAAGGANAPAVPGVDTFVIDLEAFTAAQARAARAGGFALDLSIQTTSAYDFAAFNVGIWNLALGLGLAVPTAAFIAARNQPAIPQGDGTWVRTFSVTVAGILHTAQLRARVDAGRVFWDLFVSRQGEFSNFNWFSGESDLFGADGSWTLFHGPDQPVEWLRIDWSRDRAAGTAQIRYTNIESGSAELGGYIGYGRTTEQPYDAYYQIYAAGRDNLVEIEWDFDQGAGRTRNLAFFGNTDWHYWDANREDIPEPTGS